MYMVCAGHAPFQRCVYRVSLRSLEEGGGAPTALYVRRAGASTYSWRLGMRDEVAPNPVTGGSSLFVGAAVPCDSEVLGQQRHLTSHNGYSEGARGRLAMTPCRGTGGQREGPTVIRACLHLAVRTRVRTRPPFICPSSHESCPPHPSGIAHKQ
ncbi:hypothetical protein LX36DRAFT_222492 [Colletotrichum falcatum]|nr:hypothetical protein LX36DRAFT_222492 [Colletotrichum falcatum]